MARFELILPIVKFTLMMISFASSIIVPGILAYIIVQFYIEGQPAKETVKISLTVSGFFFSLRIALFTLLGQYKKLQKISKEFDELRNGRNEDQNPQDEKVAADNASTSSQQQINQEESQSLPQNPKNNLGGTIVQNEYSIQNAANNSRPEIFGASSSRSMGGRDDRFVRRANSNVRFSEYEMEMRSMKPNSASSNLHNRGNLVGQKPQEYPINLKKGILKEGPMETRRVYTDGRYY